MPPRFASPLTSRAKTRASTPSALLALSCCAAIACFEGPSESPRNSDAGSRQLDGGSTSGPKPEPTTETASQLGCATGKVDLLFVIDNSGSMAEEQKKLARVLPDLVAVLATGNHDGKRRAVDVPTDFAPATSMHIGVVSTDLAVNLAPAPASCGTASFNPVAPDPSNPSPTVKAEPPSNAERLDKPFGDDGLLSVATAVASAGLYARPSGTGFNVPVSLIIEPDPACGELSFDKPYIEYDTGTPFEQKGIEFGCIARLGRNGCGLEQQLESMLKALTPSDSRLTFSRNTTGQGDPAGANAGFLREDAVLAIVHISDEEDCSIPDSSSELFNTGSMLFTEDINIRCGLDKYQSHVHPVVRYIDGLRALKGAQYRDRIILTSIAGLPSGGSTEGKLTYSGADELEALLNRQDMQFVPRAQAAGTNLEPTPVCESADGSAAPARRLVQLTKAFGDNGIATSICEDDYRPAIDLLSERISRHLGSCEE